MNRRGINATQMALRILTREDNIYKKEVIVDILNKYMEECQKALLQGERVTLSEVGTIIPVVKVRYGRYNMPNCNIQGGNPPYVRLKITTTEKLKEKINKVLLNNITNGIMGLLKTPLKKLQITILKENGFLSEDVEEIDYEYEEDDLECLAE